MRDEDRYLLDAVRAAFDDANIGALELAHRIDFLRQEMARVQAISGQDGYLIHEEEDFR